MRFATAKPSRLKVVTLTLVFLTAAYIGMVGKHSSRRLASLEVIKSVRARLQQELDSQRLAVGPTLGQSEDEKPSARLNVRTEQLRNLVLGFRKSFGPVTLIEKNNLLLSEALIAAAERNVELTLQLLKSIEDSQGADDPGDRSIRRDALRIQSDLLFDSQNWSSARDTYRETLEQNPDDLRVAEYVAICLYSLRQTNDALDAYEDIAKRYEERGSQRQVRADYLGAAQAFRHAARVRLWLYALQRPGASLALVRSFSRCGEAFVALRDYDQAGYFLLKAVAVQIELMQRENRSELASDLISNQSLCGKILLGQGKTEAALTHLNSAVSISRQLVTQGRTDFKQVLASVLSQRGLVRKTRGQTQAALEDFEQAATAFGELNDWEQAITWQRIVVELTPIENKKQAESDLQRYHSRHTTD